MGRDEEFLRSEKEHYGKVFVDINYAIDNVSPFISEERRKERKYVSRLPILKKYMELIQSAEFEEEREGFLKKLFDGNHSAVLLQSYKREHNEELSQLERCSKCACLNCSAECRFDACLGCRSGARIAQCDHKKINVVLHDNYTLDLINERTGRNEKYRVLSTLQDPEKDRRYIIIEGIQNSEKFVLYYYPGISEDTYGEISDEAEFDFIVSTFEGIDRL